MRSTVFALWGHALLSARIPLVVKLSPLCWLAVLRGAGGALGLAASGSGKSGCPLCFAEASERGVSPRLEGGGQCGCFCLKLDFQVTVSVRGSPGSQPWVLSACL